MTYTMAASVRRINLFWITTLDCGNGQDEQPTDERDEFVQELRQILDSFKPRSLGSTLRSMVNSPNVNIESWPVLSYTQPLQRA